MVSVWGPVGWKYLHSVAHGYPIDPVQFDVKNDNIVGTTARNYKIFFTQVGNTLPCRLCRESYIELIKGNPVRTQSREELTQWLWEIHNKVNEKLGRTYKKNDFESIRDVYESYRANCSYNPTSKGCTEPIMSHTKKRSRVTIEPLSPLFVECSLLKITIVLSIIAFLYMEYH